MRMMQNRNDFTEYCLRRLGKGAIAINVTKDQVDDRIDDAIRKYTERHFDAVEEKVLLIEVTYDDVERGFIIIPSEVVGVVEILSGNSGFVTPTDGNTGSYIFDFEYQINYNDYLERSGAYSSGSGTYSNIYILKSNQNLARWVLNKEERFEFNRRTNRLHIHDDLEKMADDDIRLAIRCYISIGEHQNIWVDEWLRDYATQLVKKQWADNLRKYGSITLPSGVTLNGETMFSEATAEIQRLEDQLKTDYELPFDFFIG